jgi:hypothetical protein
VHAVICETREEVDDMGKTETQILIEDISEVGSVLSEDERADVAVGMTKVIERLRPSTCCSFGYDCD